MVGEEYSHGLKTFVACLPTGRHCSACYNATACYKRYLLPKRCHKLVQRQVGCAFRIFYFSTFLGHVYNAYKIKQPSDFHLKAVFWYRRLDRTILEPFFAGFEEVGGLSFAQSYQSDSSIWYNILPIFSKASIGINKGLKQRLQVK